MTQQQTERDDALIAEVARAISRKVDSFGDTERTEQQRAELEWPRYREHAKAAIDLILARENWTPPAKPDRYVVIAEEITSAANIVSHGGYYELDIEAVEAVLRRNFEPPVRVIHAARCLRDGSPKGGSAELCADFILKGDQCLALNGSR